MKLYFIMAVKLAILRRSVLTRGIVYFDHVPSVIVNADHGIM